MVNTILVLGIQEANSAKTFSVNNMIKALLNTYEGSEIEVFKPISGHGYYIHADNTKAAIESGTVVSKDLRMNHEDLHPDSCGFTLEELNPIHTLFLSTNLSEFSNQTNSMSQLSMHAIVRYTYWKRQGLNHSLVINNKIEIPEKLRGIIQHADEINYFNDIYGLQELDRQLTPKTFSMFENVMTTNPEIIIVESFNNLLPPAPFLSTADHVMVTAPGSIGLIEADRARVIIDTINNVSSVPKLLEYINFQDTISIPLHTVSTGKTTKIWAHLVNDLFSL